MFVLDIFQFSHRNKEDKGKCSWCRNDVGEFNCEHILKLHNNLPSDQENKARLCQECAKKLANYIKQECDSRDFAMIV